MRVRWVALAVGVLLLCGCSMQEVEERTPIAAASLDVNGEQVELTAQTVSVSAEDTAPKTETNTVTAQSLTQGLDRFGTAAFWITAETFVLSSDAAAQEDVTEIIRTLSDEQTIRPSVRLCVVRDATGQELMETEQEADALTTLLDQSVRDGRAVDVPLYQALDVSRTEGVDLVLPALRVEHGAAHLAGSAVFHGAQQCGWLEEEQTAVLALLRGDTRRITLYLQGNTMHVTLKQASVTWEVRENNGTVRAALTITAEVPDSSKQRQQEAAQLLQTQCEELLAVLQKQGSDALGLGRIWYRQQPKRYSTEGWEAQYAALPVTVQVSLRPTQGGERK